MMVLLARTNGHLLSIPVLCGGVIFLSYVAKALLLLIAPQHYAVFPEYLEIAEDARALALVLSASVLPIFTLGFLFSSCLVTKKTSPRINVPRPTRIESSVCFTLIGLLSFFYLCSMVGASPFSAFSRDNRALFMLNFKGSGYLFFLALVLPQIAVFSLLIATKLSFIRKCAVAIGLLSVFWISSSLGGRAYLFGFALSLLWLHYRKRRPPVLLFVAAASTLLFFAGLAGLRLDDETAPITVQSVAQRVMSTYDMPEMLAIAVDRMSLANYFLGRTYIEDTILTYAPRQFFPEKPEVYGVLRIQNLLIPKLYDEAGLAATFPPGIAGEAYANFGALFWIPIFVVGGVVGIVHRASKHAGHMMTVVICIFVSTIPVFTRAAGGILPAVIMYVAACTVLQIIDYVFRTLAMLLRNSYASGSVAHRFRPHHVEPMIPSK
jgi:hypothetical protein